MLTGAVWPAHPHPLPGECLSSWLIRCAHANGMKVQTFCVRVFGSERQIWNRDIDRYAPEWLLKLMSEKTGIPFYMVTKATIRLFEGRLFEKRFISGQLRWILPLALYHRTFRNFGVQYCPQCLGEDVEPYFRLAWRLAFYTFCPRHQILLHDRCYNCQMPVSYHRAELGKPNQIEGEPLDHCWYCGSKLSEAPQISVCKWHKIAFTQWEALLKAVDRQFVNCGPINYNRLVLLHQICRLIVSVNLAPKLQPYLCLVTGQPHRKLCHSKKPFEQPFTKIKEVR